MILGPRERNLDAVELLLRETIQAAERAQVVEKYEFGVKVSIASIHKEGLVVGMRSMPGNPYDGHAVAPALDQVVRMIDRLPKEIFVDLGYRKAILPE